jgi:hypothetical protein
MGPPFHFPETRKLSMPRLIEHVPTTELDAVNVLLAVVGEAPLTATNVYGGVKLTGAAGTHIQTPDAAALDITGDIDIRVRVAPRAPNVPHKRECLLSKYATTGDQRSWAFYIDSDGSLRLDNSNDGTALVTRNSTVNPAFAASGEPLWVRVTLDVDDGASGNVATFYTSTDGTTWTILGAAVTKTGTTSIFSGTANVRVGELDATSSSRPFNGRVYAAQILSGIAGTTVADIDFTDDTEFNSTTGVFTGGQSLLWTLAGVAVFMDRIMKYPPSTTSADVDLAYITLQNALLEVLTRGWKFNTDFEFRITQDYSNRFRVPEDLLRFDPTRRPDQLGPYVRKQDDGTFSGTPKLLDIVVRGEYFYDRLQNTAVIYSATDRPQIFIDAVWGIPYEECPETARKFVTLRAARQYAERVLGGGAVPRDIVDDEQVAWKLLQEDQSWDRKRSLLNNTLFARALGNRPRLGVI